MNHINASLIRAFGRPSGYMCLAYDHYIAARLGVTLMVPSHRIGLDGLKVVEQSPIPWLEATEILAAPYDAAASIYFPDLVDQADRLSPAAGGALGDFARNILQAFAGQDGIYAMDRHWRHAQIRLSEGCEPARIFIGETGVRFAFTPDFLDGVL